MGGTARGTSFFGGAIVSDESPPSGNRYTGLRFQITWLYVPMFEATDSWDDPRFGDKYPMTVKKIMCDVMHVDQKTGQATYNIILRQLARLGLTEYDVIAGVGDGGGENEGVQGVHALFESVDPSYVRRRCAPHFAWRAFEAGAKSMGEPYKRTIALNTYLRDGVTWSRLASIAVQDEADNGLGLFQEYSREFTAIFRSAPPKLIDERPQATLDFYKWLIAREPVLKKVIVHDMRLRNLTSSESAAALETITSKLDWALRRIDTVLMQKAMYLFVFIKKHEYTASSKLSFETLIDDAVNLVTSTKCTDEVLDVLQIAGVAIDIRDMNWVELAIRQMPDLNEDDIQLLLPDVLEHHARVATSIASHMRLTSANILRSTWLAAGMLSKDSGLSNSKDEPGSCRCCFKCHPRFVPILSIRGHSRFVPMSFQGRHRATGSIHGRSRVAPRLGPRSSKKRSDAVLGFFRGAFPYNRV